MVSILGRALVAFGIVASALSAGGCGQSDCDYVCVRWSDCVDTPRDGVDGCIEQCAVKSDTDAVYRGVVEECRQCAEVRACGEAAQPCGINCTIAVNP
jgi:hypothetical protein